MAHSDAFDVACEVLESATTLERIEARGTVRIALKAAGLDPKAVTPDQLVIVAKKILPKELVARGVDDAERVCARLEEELARLDAPILDEAPESMFVRLGNA